MFPEDQFLPLSALQHLEFCERQCALIHLEQVWADNELTAHGILLHQKAHEGPDETRPGVRIVRGLPLRSARLGLSGTADVVEFHRHGPVFPVEYKRGKPKPDESDRVQLCAQALCLEEMLERAIPTGALYYGQRQRRTEVVFDDALRQRVEEASRRLHALFQSRRTPPSIREPKCQRCSLLEICLPAAGRLQRGAAAWLDRELAALTAD